jgi:hypothetical protein
MNTKSIIAMCAALAFVAVPAWADWTEGDPYKMHYPQLPDPNGWDVDFDVIVETDPDGTPTVFRGPLADDWQCIQTGTVDDIHMWVSFREDKVPDPAQGEHVIGFVAIHNNVPAGVDTDYSHPAYPAVLWGMGIDTNSANVQLLPYESGDQGWYEPYAPLVVRPDHEQYFQLNIDVPEAAEPFVQQDDEIYWLVSHMMVVDANNQRVPGKEIGWKTSISEQFMDDAVYGHPYAGQAGFPRWVPMVDPYTEASLDLAFVITGRPIPEPATFVLLLTGGLVCVGRRRRS